MVSMLDRKLLRDLWIMRGQILSITLVVAAGSAIYAGSIASYASLEAAINRHYGAERFADVFAMAKRTPVAVAEEIRDLPGVSVVQTRIEQLVRIVPPGSEDVVSGRIVSLPSGSQPSLNRLSLESGRLPDPARLDEIVIGAGFAQARGVRLSERMAIIINGRKQTFTIVGTALSPEFVFVSQPGNPLPDDRRFAIIWANDSAIAAAFDLQGSFNSVALTIAPGGSSSSVIAALDALLAPYGGTGAYERRDQASNRFLVDELSQQRTMAVYVPLLFYAIAAFLMNIVVGRVIDAQREQIAALKALGYPDGPIAVHYLKLVGVIVVTGCALGSVAGYGLGAYNIELYKGFFRFPEFPLLAPAWIPITAVLFSGAVAAIGVAVSLARVARLTPAQAMRPAIPAGHSRILARSLGDHRRLPVRVLMIVRNVIGRPLRSILTILGVSLALPMIVLSLFWFDAVAFMIDANFDRIERGDALVTFTDAVPAATVHAISTDPGIVLAEGQRIVPVRLANGHRTYRTSLVGLPHDSQLKVLRDGALARIEIPADGLMVSRVLADRLGLRVGDTVGIDILEGKRTSVVAPVVALSDDVVGLGATMDIDALNRLLREPAVINVVSLRLDPTLSDQAMRSLTEAPGVATASLKRMWIASFNEKIVSMIYVTATILIGFGILIAAGVVYNAARISLQERAWELASLRILGFGQAEVATILLSELALLILAAQPIGVVLSLRLVSFLMTLSPNESVHIPALVSVATLTSAVLIILVAGMASALIIVRRLRRLDLVAALKTRD